MLTPSTSPLPTTAPASLRILDGCTQRAAIPFADDVVGRFVSPRSFHGFYMAGSDSGLTETSLRHRLKRATAAAHRRLEAQLGLLDATLDEHRYRRVLETFYGFYSPVEIDLALLAATELPLGFPLRPRAELIERDLLALGLSPAEIVALPLCSERPELSCREDLAGSLYVLEGACLGGQALAPLLHRRLGLSKEDGAAFFAGDGEWTLPRWTVVVAWLDGLPRTGASTGKIIGAANATFDALARWARVLEGDCRGRSERL